MNKRELWIRIKEYHFSHIVPPGIWEKIAEAFGGADASTKAFAGKIGRKHGWTNGFALKAIAEYKKFVFLGVISDFNVTPSKIIDVVWHEHLLFTKAYREFCATVIEYEFDHHPELMPMEDQTGRFNAQYLDTLELYESEFGVAPPEAIWSIPKFDLEKITADGYQSGIKRRNVSFPDKNNTNWGGSDIPLYTYFDTTPVFREMYPEFDSDGGSGGSWDDNGDSDGADSSDGGDSGGCSGGCGD
jgi:hypothetical protein